MWLVSLGLALMLSIGIAASQMETYNAASNKYSIGDTVNKIVELRNSVHKSFSGRPEYTGISTQKAEEMGLMPDGVRNGKGPRNTTVALSNTGDRTFGIEVSGMERPGNLPLCVALGTRAGDAWITVEIEGDDVTGEGIDVVTEACKTASTVALRSY